MQSITSSEMCSLHLIHPSAADTAVPGEQLGVRCHAQGSHLSRGQFLLEPRFEPITSGYKSNALSTRATTAPMRLKGGITKHLTLLNAFRDCF